MAIGRGAGVYGAIIRLHGYDYRIRTGGVGEPKFVVNPVGAEYDPFDLKHLRFYINLYHSDLEKGYIPHPPAAAAQIIVDNLGGEILHIEMPEPLPEGWQPNPNMVN